MSDHHEINVAGVKISVAWIIWILGAIDLTKIITITSGLLIITYTALQIYKLWRDIKKDIAKEKFAKQLGIATVPAAFSGDE